MTITPTLKKRYSSDKHGIINIRITQDRKSQYISTKIQLHERYWNSNKKEVRSNHPNPNNLNELIERTIEKIKKERKLSDDPIPVTNNKKSFSEYFFSYLDYLTRNEKLGTLKKYNTSYQHLLGFQKKNLKNNTLFSDIDYKWIVSFNEYLNLKGLKTNTRNNYLKCSQKLYNQSLKEKHFRTYENPFNHFKFKRESVDKRRLSYGDVQIMTSIKLNKGSLVYNIRNLFLIQIYAQGLRVSDLFTLKYNNIYFDDTFSRINFFQFKTKRRHSIQLSMYLTKLICYYINPEYNRFHTTDKYELTWGKNEYYYTLSGLDRQLKRVREESLKKGDNNWEKLSNKIGDIRSAIYTKELKIIKEYSSKNPNKFIVPYLDETLLKEIEFNENVRLTKRQYNHIQSRITVYNRGLKKLGDSIGTNVRLTSHVARHTYTNLMLEISTDVYSISKSLGHSNLSITESYLKDFDIEKVDGDNSKLFRRMNLQQTALSPSTTSSKEKKDRI